MPALTFLTATGVAACLPVLLIYMVRQGHTLGCYKCTSTNNSNGNCQDPFNSINQVYEKDCYAPRPGHQGLFPGTQCLKMKYCLNDICTWIRGCVADNGGMNSDSEIGRTDHCGLGITEIMLDNKKVYGCITSCKADGCNIAPSNSPTVHLFFACVFVSFLTRKILMSLNE